jgi:hypothetical protein
VWPTGVLRLEAVGIRLGSRPSDYRVSLMTHCSYSMAKEINNYNDERLTIKPLFFD